MAIYVIKNNIQTELGSETKIFFDPHTFQHISQHPGLCLTISHTSVRLRDI